MKKKLIYNWLLLIGYKPKKTQHKERLFESGTIQISLYPTGHGYISDWREQGEPKGFCSISCKTLIETLKAAYHAIQNGYIDGKYEPLPF